MTNAANFNDYSGDGVFGRDSDKGGTDDLLALRIKPSTDYTEESVKFV